jgi:hypothetical protein
MANNDDSDPIAKAITNAKPVKWEQFERDVWSKCKAWPLGFLKFGDVKSAVKEYPTLKFKYYPAVYGGPPDTEGTWAVADDVVIREEDTLQGKKLYIRTRPKP